MTKKDILNWFKNNKDSKIYLIYRAGDIKTNDAFYIEIDKLTYLTNLQKKKIVNDYEFKSAHIDCSEDLIIGVLDG